MRSSHPALLCALALLLPGAALAKGQWTLTAAPLSLSLGHAWQTGPTHSVGLDVGAGVDALTFMVVGRSSEQQRSDEDRPADVIHLEIFSRSEPSGGFQLDVGARGSIYLQASSNDLNGGVFAGAYMEPMWGGRNVKVGPRLAAGVFTEDRAQFGVTVAPLNIRIIF
ncbi:MAG TPA: hypothetical protein VN539_08145 [Candidatus Saccharimonadales bacterium]|nr:hypothetical protein [Candidatus Saccharimonadales bacterium]